MKRISHFLRSWAKRQDGAVTVEFVVVVPFVLTLFFASVDTGITMLRQVMLDRAVDMAVREIRLGSERMDSSEEFRNAVCSGFEDGNGNVISTGMRAVMNEAECLAGIAVEMQVIDTTNFSGLDDPVRCVNRELALTPAVAFNPGSGGAAQELMLIKTCVSANPFIRLTGFFNSMPINPDGDYVIASRGIFVNEPS